MTEKLAPNKRFRFIANGKTVYEWNQTIEEVDVYITLPDPRISAKQLFCKISRTHITLGIKGQNPYLDHDLAGDVKVDSSFWTIEDGEMHITLQKAQKGKVWSAFIAGHELDAMSADQESRRLMLERFQEEHAGFDFSGAEFSGSCPDPSTFLGGISH